MATRRGWIQPLNSVPRPSLRIIVLPHSGGSTQAFRSWLTALPDDVSLLGAQYPGRAERFTEEPIDDLLEMSFSIAHEVVGLERIPTALFGHSLGAVVAYEVAVELRAAGAEPDQLLVSSSPPPHRVGGGRTHLAADDELWATVIRLGGVDDAVAGDKELRDVLLPTLRSDITASETYRPCPDTPLLSGGIRCYHGEGDPLVNADELTEWAQVSTGAFSMLTRPGGHFHISADVPGLVRDVLAAICAPART